MRKDFCPWERARCAPSRGRRQKPVKARPLMNVTGPLQSFTSLMGHQPKDALELNQRVVSEKEKLNARKGPCGDPLEYEERNE